MTLSKDLLTDAYHQLMDIQDQIWEAKYAHLNTDKLEELRTKRFELNERIEVTKKETDNEKQ